MIQRSTLALLWLTALAGCGGDDEERSGLRFANVFAQRLGAVDVRVDDEVLAENLAYGAVSPIRETSKGKHTLVARRAGVRDGEPLATCEVDLANDAHQLVYPVAQFTEDAVAYSCKVADDGFDAGPGAKLIVDFAMTFDRYSAELLAGFFAGGISVDLGRDGADGTIGLDPKIQLSLTADTVHEVAVNSGPSQIAAFSLPAFADGVRAHALLIGEAAPLDPIAGGTKLLIVPVDGEAQLIEPQPIVYIYNARYDRAPVDIDHAGVRIVEDLAYKRLAGPIMRASGSLNYALVPGVAPSVADFAALAPGSVQLIVIAANNTATIIRPDSAPFGGGIRVRAIHAANVGALSFRYEYAGNLSAPIGNLAFGESSLAEGAASTSTGTIALYNGATRVDENEEFGSYAYALGYARGIAIAVGTADPVGNQAPLELDTIDILSAWAWF